MKKSQSLKPIPGKADVAYHDVNKQKYFDYKMKPSSFFVSKVDRKLKYIEDNILPE